ncbi:uncharacterized protein [Rutidosis leptorrhynchoides]|uniref:uncharacterized protein n=1 Tax=Rutidosis leptorrhynchoides TaxID=125765 RepID=UPI003A995E39
MEDLIWDTNMSFPWSNITNQQHQEIVESFILGSEDIFSSPIQDARKTDSKICSSPLTSTNGPSQDSLNATSSYGLGSISQYWPQALSHANNINECNNVIPTNNTIAAATHTSPEHKDGISVIFSDYKNICNTNYSISSGDSATKDSDDGIVSQCSLAKRPKRPRSDPGQPVSSNINFGQSSEPDEQDSEAIAQMKEMIYRAAAFRPVSFTDDEVTEKRRRKNVKISSDPQTVAARQRRERISDKIRVLQKLVPGGNKMDTASMLDEAANYLKFLRSQVKALEQLGMKIDYLGCGTTSNAYSISNGIQGVSNNPNVTVGVPFPMQTHFLLPHQQIYPNLS